MDPFYKSIHFSYLFREGRCDPAGRTAMYILCRWSLFLGHWFCCYFCCTDYFLNLLLKNDGLDWMALD